MDQVIEFLKQVNIAQIIIILSGFWVFYNRLDKKIEKVRDDLKQDINKLEQDVNKLSEKIDDVDRRLCRIEGSLATQGHCLFNQSKPEQKAL